MRPNLTAMVLEPQQTHVDQRVLLLCPRILPGPDIKDLTRSETGPGPPRALNFANSAGSRTAAQAGGCRHNPFTQVQDFGGGLGPIVRDVPATTRLPKYRVLVYLLLPA